MLTKTSRNVIGLVLRPVVSVVLLVVLFARLGAGDVWQMLRTADPAWLTAGLGLVVAALLISAWKWQVLLAAQGLRLSLRPLFTSYLVGLFFNNFLPSNIGGDVARVHDVAKRTGRGAAAAASVIGERLVAGLALAATAVAALPFAIGVTTPVAAGVVGVLVLFGGLVALGASPAVRRRFSTAMVGGRLAVLGRVAAHIGEAFADRRALAQVFALSLVFQATVVLVGWVAFLAIGAPVSLESCFLFIPIISAIQLIPVSLNGLGVREGSYILFFGSVGLSATQAVAGSLLFALVVTAVSLAGGVVFAARR